MKGKRKLAVAVTAMSIAGVCGGIGAAGAQAQTEVLQGTATTIGGQTGGSCASVMWKSVSVNFSAVGSATGPYPGVFTNTNANGGVSGEMRPLYEQLHVSIPFTIKSGATTIVGTITNPYPWMGGWFICGGSGLPVGFSASAFPANHSTYTATIYPSRQPINGTASISGNFYIAKGTNTTVTETLTFP
jgi:hypothetical protein